MNLSFVNIVGYTAAVVGVTIMLPQVIKSLRTKSVEDVSFLMLIIFLVNCALWAIYGSLIFSFPVIICNIIAFVIISTQLILKIKYTKARYQSSSISQTSKAGPITSSPDSVSLTG